MIYIYKVDFQRHLGVAESEIKKRTLGRGRAKCREIVSQNLPPVGRSVDSTVSMKQNVQCFTISH